MFWEKYGEFSSVTKLYSTLREERTVADKADAELAKKEVDFTATYMHRGARGKRAVLMKKDIDIARLWRENNNISVQWWHTF